MLMVVDPTLTVRDVRYINISILSLIHTCLFLFFLAFQVLMVSGNGISERGPEIDGSPKTNVMLLLPGADAWVYGQSMIGSGVGHLNLDYKSDQTL